MTKPSSWQIVEEPLRALADVVDQLPAVMLVGAVCRDVLHEEHGHKGALRRTDDVDLALAVNGWDEFEDLTARLEDVRDSAGSVRYLIGGCRVDLVPFGQGIEAPDGVLALPPSGHGMSVYGFQDVFDESREIDLGGGLSCRLPTTPGYVLLKLKAWIDRSPDGQYKDGGDIACAIYWYLESKVARDRLYEDNVPHLEAADWDEPIALVRLLVADALSVVSEARRQELAGLWPTDAGADALLADALKNDLLPAPPWKGQGRDRLAGFAAAATDVIRSVVRGSFSASA